MKDTECGRSYVELMGDPVIQTCILYDIWIYLPTLGWFEGSMYSWSVWEFYIEYIPAALTTGSPGRQKRHGFTFTTYFILI